jgi:predicted ATPase
MIKKFLTTLSCLLFFASIGVSLFAEENKKPEKEKNKKVDIQKAYGEITSLNLENYTLTIKQEDGSEITLKATTEKMQEEVKKYKVGDKVKVLYIKNKDGENILFKIISPEEKPKKEKPNK